VPAAAVTFLVGAQDGDGGWDYLALDTAGHRLFGMRLSRNAPNNPIVIRPFMISVRPMKRNMAMAMAPMLSSAAN